MIVSSIYKNLCSSRLLMYSGSLAHLSNVSNGRFDGYRGCKSPRNNGIILFPSYKSYSSETQTKPSVTLPALFDGTLYMWPSLFGLLRSSLNKLIVTKLDNEFDDKAFLDAATQALCIVSRALANEDYDRLKYLVTKEALEIVKQKISTLSEEQKELIAVQQEDIYLSHLHDCTLVSADNDSKQISVQIMAVHHYMKGYGRMKNAGETIPIKMLADCQDRVLVANYRYVRDLSENARDSSWWIDLVNHFSPYNQPQRN